ncbi:PCNA [Symbiodinium sp. CCMP2592]|nr:PCNA [Symbiodinium sp. CCMP2592]
MAMVLDAQLQQAGLFKKVAESMKDLCKEVNFDCSERGMQVQSMDSSHVALVSLMLRESAFAEFKCERPVSLGMNVDSLTKILKMTGPSDTLKIRHRGDTDVVNFQCEGSDDRISEFDLKLFQIENEHMEIPEQHYKVVAKLPSSEFQKICRDLKEFGETLHLTGDKDGLKFVVSGDIGSGNVLLKPRETEKPEEKVSLTVHEPVTAAFALRYLVNFSKASPLCGSVTLGFAPDAPLLVQYDLETEEKGHMKFYLVLTDLTLKNRAFQTGSFRSRSSSRIDSLEHSLCLRLPVLCALPSMAMVLDAQLQQAGLFKKVAESMKDLCKEVNFDCSERGMQVQSMDSSHVALVSLMLRESAFAEFKCERPVSLGMNVDSLTKILKMTGPSDTLKIRHRGDTDVVNFQCEGSDDRISEFDLKLFQIENEHMEIPEQHYKVVAKLPSSEFQKICRDLKEFGETLHLTGDKDGLKFVVSGDIGSGNVLLKPRETEKPEEKVSLTVHEPVTAAFALRYLVNFSKASPLCGSVTLGFAPDAPLLVQYDLETEEKGHMKFYLAPKIDE